jgi:hypothetical protein
LVLICCLTTKEWGGLRRLLVHVRTLLGTAALANLIKHLFSNKRLYWHQSAA